MKKEKIFLAFVICSVLQIICPSMVYSQKVSDILEKGIVVKNKHAIFLRLIGDKFHYEVASKKSSNNFDPLKESFFLLNGNGANVYLAPPLNPLSFSTSTEVSFSNDEINAKAAENISSIITSLSSLITPSGKSGTILPPADPGKPINGKKGKKGKKGNTDTDFPVVIKIIDSTCIKQFIKIKNDFEEITTLLKVNKKDDLVAVFNGLKKLDFNDKGVTNEGQQEAKKNLDVIEEYYSVVNKKIESVKKNLTEYEACKPAPDDNFIRIFVMNQIVKQQEEVLQGYSEAVKNVRSIYAIVKKVYDASEGEGKEWQIFLGRVSMEDEKIATYTVIVNTDGYALSDDKKEITKTTKKVLVESKLKFRKFQRFIPEISAGVALTYLKFPKYGTSTDPVTGKQVVAMSGEDEFKKINFTSMVNFNYFIPGSPIHPFWQIGIGATAGYPTFFTGIGGRINVGLKRIAVSTGFAGTWIKTLSKLKVGDEISGTADLENDIKYEFSFPLKPYLGIQYNF